MPAIQRRWTADAVRELIREDQAWPRYEVIDGELLVTPAPRDAHQFACFILCMLLNEFLEREPVVGVATISPSDVPIPPDNLVQPDVYVVPAYESDDGQEIDWPTGTYLLLAAEVLSRSSLRTDRITKHDLYLNNGVAEYWIVDLDARVVERRRPKQSPELFRDTITWTPRGTATLTIDLPSYFDRVAAKDRMHTRWRASQGRHSLSED